MISAQTQLVGCLWRTLLIPTVPASIAIILFGEDSTTNLLVFSQVMLSLELSFVVIPLVMFTWNRRLMGEFVNPLWLQAVAWLVASIIAILNGWLLLQTIF